jgi:hypothetical protein
VLAWATTIIQQPAAMQSSVVGQLAELGTVELAELGTVELAELGTVELAELVTLHMLWAYVVLHQIESAPMPFCSAELLGQPGNGGCTSVPLGVAPLQMYCMYGPCK